jgi:hypothetical protein
MIDLDAVAELRPPAAPLDPALKAQLRAQLFGDVATEADLPAGQLVELRRVRKPGRSRLWKIAAPSVAAGLLVLGLVVIARRPDSGPNAATPITAPTSPTAPAASIDLSTTTTTDSAGAIGLPPEVQVPVVVPVLDPNPFGEAPLREDPLETWLRHTPDQTRWFVNRDGSGQPLNGIRVTMLPASEWEKSFDPSDAVDLGRVQARTLGDPVRTVAWQVDDGVLAFEGVDVDAAKLLDAARENAAATAAVDVVAPDGWGEVPVPVLLSSIEYRAEGVAVSLWRADSAVDVSTAAFMEPTRMGTAEAISAGVVLVLNLGDYQTLITRVDADRYITISAPIALDLSSLSGSVRLVPPDRVDTWSTFPSQNPVPADAVVNLGEISRGRWYALRYSNDDGLCIELRTANFGGAATCVPEVPGNERCPILTSGGGIGLPWEFTVLFPYDTGSGLISVSQDGVASDATVEHSGGYTLVSGPSGEAVSRFDITIDGQPVCPLWAEQSRAG